MKPPNQKPQKMEIPLTKAHNKEAIRVFKDLQKRNHSWSDILVIAHVLNESVKATFIQIAGAKSISKGKLENGKKRGN